MAKDKKRYSDHRQPLSETGSWHPDEFIFGITRGACAPARRNPGRAQRESFEAGSGFEETYPRYPGSELVRPSIGLGHWLARMEEKLRQSFGHSAMRPQAGAKSYSQHFVRPVASSHRWR